MPSNFQHFIGRPHSDTQVDIDHRVAARAAGEQAVREREEQFSTLDYGSRYRIGEAGFDCGPVTAWTALLLDIDSAAGGDGAPVVWDSTEERFLTRDEVALRGAAGELSVYLDAERQGSETVAEVVARIGADNVAHDVGLTGLMYGVIAAAIGASELP